MTPSKLRPVEDPGSLLRDRQLRANAARGVAPATMPGAAPRSVADIPVAPEPPIMPDPNRVDLGLTEFARNFGMDLRKLVEGRLLIQGVSGAGKSWLLRRLLEQTADRIQQIVLDPEGEFKSLADELGHLHVPASRFNEGQFAAIAERARQHRVSLVLDLSDMDREDQLKGIAAFFHALVNCDRSLWTPVLVAVDEAHLFAPFGGQGAESTAIRKAAIAAMTDLMSRGRKRGLVGVLATQRIARLAKSVASEIQNFLIGMNTLDLDIKRAAEMIGWSARKASDRLPLLPPGSFVASGPAMPNGPMTVMIGTVRSRHAGAAPAMLAPAVVSVEEASAALDLEGLIEEAESDAEILAGTEPAGYRAVRAFIKHPAFMLAGRIVKALIEVAPNGVTLENLADHLEVPPDELRAALVLLESYNAVELAGDGATLGSPDAIAGLARDLVRHFCAALKQTGTAL